MMDDFELRGDPDSAASTGSAAGGFTAPEHSLHRGDFQGLSHMPDFFKSLIAMRNPIFFNRMIVIVTVLALVPLAAADDDRQPMEVLREGVSQGLAVLDDQTYRGVNGRAAQEARIRELTMTLFDFTTMSRMVLSSHWDDFTAAQQTAFVQAFRAFLQRTYLPILLDRYDGERFEYVRQTRLSTSRVRVEMRVLHRGRAIPVDVKMIRRIGRWRVYDVDALGFSAVAIYRAQFKWLLGRETPVQIIERLQRSQRPPPEAHPSSMYGFTIDAVAVTLWQTQGISPLGRRTPNLAGSP